MEIMEEMASRQIEAGENERDSLLQEIHDYQVEGKKQLERIKKLESAMQEIVKIDVNDYEANELRYLIKMEISKLKQLMEEQ